MRKLIEKILDAMIIDDEDTEEQSEYLTKTYKEASEAEKKVIDECFISLCGWSLQTLIEGQNE